MDRIRIRSAELGDFEWVANLMDEALSNFYGGDHKAHAKRIFETHINGGVDHQGHFSAGQYMFIAEFDGNRSGLLHLVVKKQGTIKISPLIVHKEFQGSLGIGSELLKFALEFAKMHNSRQIYCTVAKSNNLALNFFLKKGFKVTGMAKQHYMKGQDELMLYMRINQDLGFKSPHVSVVPFDHSKHAESVRNLVISSMPNNFDGVDDKWVDALFSGYERRHTNDINQKFKIIYVAEIEGKVYGVVGATPKKGNPIKLMPLISSNSTALEALLTDISWLLGDYGHKIYTHIVPRAWEVSCLQDKGWELEAQFPGGYSSESIVQQWGLVLDERNTMQTLRIKKPYYDAIVKGQKTIEVRVGYDSIKRLKSGQQIRLSTHLVDEVVKIESVEVFNTFEDLLDKHSYSSIAPQLKNRNECLELLREIYPKDKENLGVYALKISLTR